MRAALLAALATLGVGASAIAQDGYIPWSVTPHGGVAGGDALLIPNGDIINVRNIQGGTVTDPNLDIGAGSEAHRGALSLNYDVGRTVRIYDGHRHLLATFSSHGIRFYRRVRGNFGR